MPDGGPYFHFKAPFLSITCSLLPTISIVQLLLSPSTLFHNYFTIQLIHFLIQSFPSQAFKHPPSFVLCSQGNLTARLIAICPHFVDVPYYFLILHFAFIRFLIPINFVALSSLSPYPYCPKYLPILGLCL